MSERVRYSQPTKRLSIIVFDQDINISESKRAESIRMSALVVALNGQKSSNTQVTIFITAVLLNLIFLLQVLSDVYLRSFIFYLF